MIEGSEKYKCQLAFELQNLRVFEKRSNMYIYIVKRSHLLSSHPQHFISFHFNLITLFHLCFDLKTTLHGVFGIKDIS